MEVVPSVLPFTEVVPKNVAWVGADRTEQPQIGIPSQLFKQWGVRGQEAALLSLSRSLSSRLRCFAVVKPHHAGEAYSREATVVSLATSCSYRGRRACEFIRQTVMMNRMSVRSK